MGTNFYWNREPACRLCGSNDESKHIGKSSGGWCFSLHVYPDEGIRDLDDWKRLWTEGEIRDEYGAPIPPAAMEECITVRSWKGRKVEFDYDANHAQPGPSGLARHKIGFNCIGHGKGTWDLIVGEFS